MSIITCRESKDKIFFWSWVELVNCVANILGRPLRGSIVCVQNHQPHLYRRMQSRGSWLGLFTCTVLYRYATSVHVAAGGEAKVKVHPSAVSLFKDRSLVINSDLMSLVPQLIT